MGNVNDQDIRGRILKTLDNQYPTQVSIKMLAYGLKAARYECGRRQLLAHLAYLQDKDYINIHNVGVTELELSRDMVKLTAKGKDLVEGNIGPDPGVMLL